MDKNKITQALNSLINENKIIYTRYANIRDPSSGKIPLPRRDIVRCLKTGIITEGPFSDLKIENGFKITISKQNDPKTEVVAVVVPDKYILVITAYTSNP